MKKMHMPEMNTKTDEIGERATKKRPNNKTARKNRARNQAGDKTKKN